VFSPIDDLDIHSIRSLESPGEAKESKPPSKEPSSEPQFTDAEKEIKEDEGNDEDDDDSEYEDVDDEEDDGTTDQSSTKPQSDKANTSVDADEERINVKPRRLGKKRDDDEHSEEFEPEGNQSAKAKPNQRKDKV
jgi:hypothetical protein